MSNDGMMDIYRRQVRENACLAVPRHVPDIFNDEDEKVWWQVKFKVGGDGREEGDGTG